MTILVVIDHDIIVRHFLHSHVFDDLARKHHLVFVFPEEGYKRIKSDISARDVSGALIRRLTVFVARLKVWQHLMLADMLRWRAGSHFAAMRRFHRQMAGRKATILFSALAMPGVFQIFRAWSHRRIRALPYRDLDSLLDREQPDAIIHPSVLAGVFINDLVAASRLRRIPLIAIMNSWDNPSTKRAMTGQPDWLLVWGPQTQAHGMKFLGMPRERVICFGAAQFDLYRHNPRIDRGEFCRRHDIDQSARVLLYAGSSKGTDEFSHLCRLDDAIASGDFGNTIVVYRPHPWGDGGKGGSRTLDHPWRHVRIEQTMRGYLERVKAGSLGITLPDYRDTHDLLASVDALISPLSTIIIEAALHGKPVICFLPDEEDSGGHYSLALPLTHFEELFAEPRFLVVRGNAALIPGVRMLLDKVGDKRFAAELQQATRLFVSEFDRPYGERLLEFVERVARNRSRRSAVVCEHEQAASPMTCRIGFLFKAGRTQRLQIDCPTEFFYGMPELAAAGWDIGVITDEELGISSAPRSWLWRILSRVSHALFGLSAWVPQVLAQARHVAHLNGFDVLVATTNSYGLALGTLKRRGLLRSRVVFLAMGLAEDNISALWRAAYRWALRDVEVYALADTDSEVLGKVLRRHVGIFSFGVDTKFWRGDTRTVTKDFVLSIGNDRSRDYDLLIRAWRPEYPLLKLVTKLPVQSHAANVSVIHGDWHAQSLSDAEIRELYQQARFIVLPIRHTYQPSGQSACLQAMACGRAVAITDFPGLWAREAMIDGETCVLLGRPGSLEGIQAGVERLLRAPDWAEQIGANARRLVEEKFHVGAMADAMAVALSKGSARGVEAR